MLGFEFPSSAHNFTTVGYLDGSIADLTNCERQCTSPLAVGSGDSHESEVDTMPTYLFYTPLETMRPLFTDPPVFRHEIGTIVIKQVAALSRHRLTLFAIPAAEFARWENPRSDFGLRHYLSEYSFVAGSCWSDPSTKRRIQAANNQWSPRSSRNHTKLILATQIQQICVCPHWWIYLHADDDAKRKSLMLPISDQPSCRSNE